MAALLLALAALPFAPRPAGAQVVTDGSFGPPTTVVGPDHQVGAGLGRQAGANLFHSFSRFDLSAGESATFSGPSGVANIISRVTGGQVSSIDGQVRSAIPGAAFFLVNPAGLVLGPNASFEVDGALHLSGAHWLRFADGQTWRTDQAGATTLSVAPVSAFGFDDSPGGALTLSGVGGRLAPNTPVPPGLAPGAGAALTMTARSIAIDTDRPATLGAPYTQVTSVGGQVSLTAAGSAGEVPLDHRLPATFPVGGTIVIGGAANIRQLGGEGILLRGGDITLAGEAQVSASGTNSAGAGPITVQAQRVMMLDASSLLGSAFGGLPSADLVIEAGGQILLRHTIGANVTQRFLRGLANSAAPGTGGSAGAIRLSAPLIDIGGEAASIATTSFGEGNSGAVTIEAAQEMRIANLTLSTLATGSGQAGPVTLRSPTILISDSVFSSGAGLPFLTGFDQVQGQGSFTRIEGARIEIVRSEFDSASNNAGPAGSLELRGDTITLTDSRISSAANQSGPGGLVGLLADARVSITGSTLSAESVGSGRGGDIVVIGPIVALDDVLLTTATRSDASAGNIVVDGGQVALLATLVTSDAGTIDPVTGARAPTLGGSGRIGLWADQSLRLARSGATSRTASAGNGNLVWLRGPLMVLQDSSISAETFGDGAAGSLLIEGQSLQLDNSGIASANAPVVIDGQWLNPDAAGRAGDVTISLTADFTASGARAGVNSATTGRGDGGDVSLQARVVTLRDGAAIFSDSLGSGTAGNLRIDAGESINLRAAQITTQSNRTDGGNVVINAPDRVVLLDSIVSTSVAGSGDGGNITIDPRFIVLQGNSAIVASAIGGNGGNIRLTIVGNGAFLQSTESVVNASSSFGVDGNVDIIAPAQDILGSLKVLEVGYLDPGALARRPCSESVQTSQGRFIIIGARPPAALAGTAPTAAEVATPSGTAAASRVPDQWLLAGAARADCLTR